MRVRNVMVWLLFVGAAFSQTQSVPPQPVPEARTDQQQTAQASGSAQSKIDPTKEADIRQLMNVAGLNALMAQMMGNMETSMRPLMQSALPPGEYREKLIHLFFAKFQSEADIQQLLNSIVPLYDKYLSDKEIKDLIQFYQTPLGQKTIQVMPKLMTEAQEAGRRWGEGVGRQSMIDVLAEHPELQTAMEDAKKSAQPK